MSQTLQIILKREEKGAVALTISKSWCAPRQVDN